MPEFTRQGQQFGALQVIKRDRTTRETIWWICQCKCGQFRTVEESRLISGKIAACLKCEVKNKQANLD